MAPRLEAVPRLLQRKLGGAAVAGYANHRPRTSRSAVAASGSSSFFSFFFFPQLLLSPSSFSVFSLSWIIAAAILGVVEAAARLGLSGRGPSMTSSYGQHRNTRPSLLLEPVVFGIIFYQLHQDGEGGGKDK